MNYIWDLMIAAEQAGLTKPDIIFRPARSYSPYMELSPDELNVQTFDKTIEINPLYRFEHILGELAYLNPNEESEVREVLFDIIIHFLADMDRMQGMSKRECYISILIRDLQDCRFGEHIQEHIGLFNRREQERIANNLLRLYETGEALHWYKDTMRTIFPACRIYAHCEDRDELIVVIGEEERRDTVRKAEVLQELLLPFRFHVEYYWKYHFGMMDINETMIIGATAIY